MEISLKENRQKIFDNYVGIKTSEMKRSFLEYDRYYEAYNLLNYLKEKKIQLLGLKIFCYGCGVGDYGITFLREDSSMVVIFYDFMDQLKFVGYRVRLEGLPYVYFLANKKNENKGYCFSFCDYDLIIFAEVLEHLDNPLEVLSACSRDRVKYLFTTSFPYITDLEEFSRKGHSQIAKQQQIDCARFLEEKYKIIVNFKGQLNLWQLK